MTSNHLNNLGLTSEQVHHARKKFGKNVLDFNRENKFLNTFKRIVKDPMMILLFIAAAIYFFSQKIGDGIFLTFAIVFQASISIFQYTRSKNALDKLKEFSQPHCTVIRDDVSIQIKSEDIVVGDKLILEEGDLIMADGTILQAHDFSVDESILTGESIPVVKSHSAEDGTIYRGTTVVSGQASATVINIGQSTKLGTIGKNMEQIREEKTPLELQIGRFVKKMAIIGAVVFLMVWMIHYWYSHHIWNSLLQSLTLAMSILPEEIPVAFTVFMALGAWRLMKKGIIVKQMKTVETLGSATVLCTDKTGTITENKMSLSHLYLLSSNRIFLPNETTSEDEKNLIRWAMWASEPVPFDPMEIALHKAYSGIMTTDERMQYKLVHEYPLGGTPPMMTHVMRDHDNHRIIAAKGTPEALIHVSNLTNIELSQIQSAIETLTIEGNRVLAVGISHTTNEKYPIHQQDLSFQLIGLVSFYDPPKKNIHLVLERFYKAGITVKIITGDHAQTTIAIAKQIGLKGIERSITGDELMLLSKSELKECVMNTSIFTRMYPEAKLRIINALKSNHQIVAMTGDGVNDGPALKAAHIGIAMGRKGTEIAKQAASLILLEDDLSKIVDAIAMGRKIYANLKKAIRYIISIHIPIVLIVLLPLIFNWIYPNIFSPIHIIFLEIIMGITCSIAYENEPIEKNTMSLRPKAITETFFNWKELSISIIQGLVITAGLLFIYQFSVRENCDEAQTRSMIFATLITANIFLTLINRSFYYAVWTTLGYKNHMIRTIFLSTIALLGLILYFPPLTDFFELKPLEIWPLAICLGIGLLSVVWVEVLKYQKRKRKKSSKKTPLRFPI